MNALRAIARPGSRPEVDGAGRWAWMVPVLAVLASGSVTDALAAPSSTAAMGASILLGVLGGYTWEWLHHRDLGERLLVWAVVLVAAGVLALLPGVSAESPPTQAWAGPGVLAGLVLAVCRRVG